MSIATRLFTALLLSSAFTVSGTAAEKRITRAQLPEAVRRTADDQSKGATVMDYTTDVENGRREYEAEMISNGHSKDVTIAPDGHLIEIEEQVELQALPGQVVSALRRKAGRGEIMKVESIMRKGVVIAYEAQVQRAGQHSEIQVGPNGRL